MFGFLTSPEVNEKLTREGEQCFAPYDRQDEARCNLYFDDRCVSVRKHAKDQFKSHYYRCGLKKKELQTRDIEMLGWAFCHCPTDKVDFRAVDFAQLPPDELLVPTARLTAYFHGQTLEDLMAQKAEQHLKMAKTSLEEFSEIDKKHIHDLKHRMMDYRKLLPTLVRLGGNLRKAYRDKHGTEMPHSGIQFGRDIPLNKMHNQNRCEEFQRLFSQMFMTDVEVLKGQQHYCNADFDSLIELGLPDVSGLLRNVILSDLQASGVRINPPMFVGLISKPVANIIASHDVFQEAPTATHIEHGTFSHLYQIADLAGAGLYDQALYQKIIDKDVWGMVQDWDASFAADLTCYTDGAKKRGAYFNQYAYTSAMPENLNRLLTTGSYSRGIQTILDEDNPERIQALASLVLARPRAQIEAMDIPEVKAQLQVCLLNLRALEVADIASQYQAIHALKDSGGWSPEKYFNPSRGFFTQWQSGATVKHYMSLGWHVYRMETFKGKEMLRPVTRPESIEDISSQGYILYPPEVQDIPEYLKPLVIDERAEAAARPVRTRTTTCCTIL